MKRLHGLLLFLLLVGLPIEGYYEFGYVLFGCLVVVFLWDHIANDRPTLLLRPVDMIAATFLVCWAYGLALGLIVGNERQAVMRNFAGMVVYGLYYVLRRLRPTETSLVWAVVVAGLANTVIGFYLLISYQLGGVMLWNLELALSGGARALYSANVSVVYGLLAISVFQSLGLVSDWSAFFGRSRLVNWLFRSDISFYLLSFYYVIIPFGRGFIINYVALLVIAPFAAIVSKRRLDAFPFIRRAVVLIGLMALYHTATGVDDSQSSAFFSLEHDSNVIRLEQSSALASEFSFWGAGLGAALKSGYVRDFYGYGFEQSFENVIHKFGVVSVTLFVSYVAVIVLAVIRYIRTSDVFSVFAIALSFCFLIPSLGNPMLFAPVHVVLHSFAIYIVGFLGCRPILSLEHPARAIS